MKKSNSISIVGGFLNGINLTNGITAAVAIQVLGIAFTKNKKSFKGIARIIFYVAYGILSIVAAYKMFICSTKSIYEDTCDEIDRLDDENLSDDPDYTEV